MMIYIVVIGGGMFGAFIGWAIKTHVELKRQAKKLEIMEAIFKAQDLVNDSIVHEFDKLKKTE